MVLGIRMLQLHHLAIVLYIMLWLHMHAYIIYSIYGMFKLCIHMKFVHLHISIYILLISSKGTNHNNSSFHYYRIPAHPAICTHVHQTSELKSKPGREKASVIQH